MRFLILTEIINPMPPEIAQGMIQATKDWITRNRESGKMTDVWSQAAFKGGGGILDVESNEELDRIMGLFPIAPFARIQVIPLSDVFESLDTMAESIRNMM